MCTGHSSSRTSHPLIYKQKLEVTCGQHAEVLAVNDVLDRDYRYKSVATQLLHDARLTHISYTVQKYCSTGDRTSAGTEPDEVLYCLNNTFHRETDLGTQYK